MAEHDDGRSEHEAWESASESEESSEAVGEVTESMPSAFSFAQDVVKQIITLSTGILALTLTFQKNIVPSGTDTTLLKIAWGCYLGSVLFGLLALMVLADELGNDRPSIDRGGIRGFASTQAVLFFVALGFTFVYGLHAAP